MPPASPDSPVTLSVLDRLIDEEPRNSKEVPWNRAQSVRLLRAAVRRDLEWLLNTRRVAVPVEDSMKELTKSIYNFGLPDFTGYSMGTAEDRARLIKQLQNALKNYETRIARVRIVPLETEGSEKIRTLRFRIEGLLLMIPEPEHVTFDAELQLTSGTYKVDNAR